MNVQEIRSEVDRCLARREFDKMLGILDRNTDVAKKDNELFLVPFACQISAQEEQAGVQPLLFKVSSLEELKNRAVRLQFYLRRIEYDAAGECMEEIYEFLTKNQVSVYELISTIYSTTFHHDKMLAWLQGNIQSGKLRL